MLKNYLKIAFRNVMANRVITLLNVFGLAIGVAVCLTIGIWLQRELSFDNFHPNGEKIFRLTNTFKSESESFSQAPSGAAFGAQLPKLLPEVEAGCRLFEEAFKIKRGDVAFIEQHGLMVDSNFFEFFGFRLKEGNPATVLSSPDQIVLTERLATKYFGNENPIGKTIELDGSSIKTVSGIVENPPVNSHIQFDLLLSSTHLINQMMQLYEFDVNNFWVGGWPNTYVQLKNPQNWQASEAKINAIAAEKSKKEWEENKMSYKYHLQPIYDIHLKSNLRYDADNNGSLARVKIFGIVGIIVLLLACINYINLTTAGAMKRAKETAVKKVVGAAKSQLIRQFFLETFIICTLSVGLGFLLFKTGLPYFANWIEQPYSFEYNIFNFSLLFALILFLTSISGFYPAAVLSSFNISNTLKGSFLQGIQGGQLRKGLVVAQFTMTIAIISTILIINQQMNFIKNKSLGFNREAVVEVKFYGDTSVINHYNALRNELLNNKGILNISKHGGNVVGGLGNGWLVTQNLQGDEISTSLYQMSVDTSYFDTYDMQLVAGRFFSNDMPTDMTQSVLVNEAAVRTFGWLKPENAIGKRFGTGEDARYVIGVVRDFNFESLHKPVEALLIGYSSQGNTLSLKLDATQLDGALAHIEKTWNMMVSSMPFEYSFVDEQVALQYGNEKKMEGVFYGFSVLSLLIACLGLFGLSMFVVERRIKEIGIRKVLGASVSSIVSLLSKDFVLLVLLSVIIASPIAWYFMSQWLENFAYRIDISWWSFVLAGVVALVIALVTISFQAIRAAVANPVESLKSE
ncbi:MAG: ABC transporter permease [Saprospiraceae bacterium]|nr:ABC transporter permease [Saprospiraceae bacterium]